MMRQGIKRVVNDFPEHLEKAENAEKSLNAKTAENRRDDMGD